jgi:hypothetical protein
MSEQLWCADQTPHNIRIYKYTHFFSKWDLPYEKRNDAWRIKFNKSTASIDKDWFDLTKEDTPIIKCYQLNCSQQEKKYRTEPLLIFFENTSCEKIIVKVDYADGPTEVRGPLLKSNDNYFQISAYNIYNDEPQTIQIFVDNHPNPEKTIHIDWDKHTEPIVYKINDNVNKKNFDLAFIDMKNELSFSIEPLELKSPSLWTSCLTTTYLKQTSGGIKLNQLETISKPDLKKGIIGNNIETQLTGLKNSPNTFRYFFIIKDGFIDNAIKKEHFYININNLFQQWNIPPATITFNCQYQSFPERAVKKSPRHILFLPWKVKEDLAKEKIEQLLKNISFDIQYLYENFILYQYDSAAKKTKFYECYAGRCDELALTWKKLKEKTDIPVQYTIDAKDKIRKAINNIEVIKENNEPSIKYLNEIHDICDSLKDFDNISLNHNINIVFVCYKWGLNANEDKNFFDLIPSDAKMFLNFWLINLADCQRTASTLYTYKTPNTKIFNHDYYHQVSKIKKRITIGPHIDYTQTTYLNSFLQNLYNHKKMNDENYILSFVLPSILVFNIEPSVSIICEDEGVILKSIDLKEGEQFCIVNHFRNNSDNKGTRCIIPENNVLKISLKKLSDDPNFFEFIKKTFKYATKPTITFQVSFDFTNKEETFTIKNEEIWNKYKLFNGIKAKIDLSNNLSYWLNRPVVYEILFIILGCFFFIHFLIRAFYGPFKAKIESTTGNNQRDYEFKKIEKGQFKIYDFLPFYLNYKLKIFEGNKNDNNYNVYDLWSRKSIESIEQKGYKISWRRSKDKNDQSPQNDQSILEDQSTLDDQSIQKKSISKKLKKLKERLTNFFERPLFKSDELHNIPRVICYIMIVFFTIALVIGSTRMYLKSDSAGFIVMTVALILYFVGRISVKTRLKKINSDLSLQFNIFEQLFIALLADMMWYLCLILYTN